MAPRDMIGEFAPHRKIWVFASAHKAVAGLKRRWPPSYYRATADCLDDRRGGIAAEVESSFAGIHAFRTRLLSRVELSLRGRVALVEQETVPGYHSASRSAAVLSENYGSVGWQMLSSASRSFFENPPAGFTEHPLLRPLGALFLAAPGKQEVELDRAAAELDSRGVRYEAMDATDAQTLCPVLRIEGYSRALYEPGCAEIEAHALLQGYLRFAKKTARRFS
jgi:hypothetical protein